MSVHVSMLVPGLAKGGMTRAYSLASALLAALQPAPAALACTLDSSAGTLVVEMKGEGVEALLSRLIDSTREKK